MPSSSSRSEAHGADVKTSVALVRAAVQQALEFEQEEKKKTSGYLLMLMSEPSLLFSSPGDEYGYMPGIAEQAFRELIKSHDRRHARFETVLPQIRSLLGTASLPLANNTRKELRENYKKILEGRKNSERFIKLHNALLLRRHLFEFQRQYSKENSAFMQKGMRYSFENFSTQLIELREKAIKALDEGIDLLTQVPHDMPLAVSTKYESARSVLILVLGNSSDARLSKTMEFHKFYEQFETNRETRPGSTAGSSSKIVDAEFREEKKPGLEEVLFLREAVSFLDKSIWQTDLCEEVIPDSKKGKEALALNSLEKKGYEKLSFIFQRLIIAAQVHLPSRVANNVGLPEDPKRRLLEKASNNMQVLDGLMEKALKKTAAKLAGFQRGLKKKTYEMLPAHYLLDASDEPTDADLELSMEEKEETYHLLRLLPKAYEETATQLDYLASRIRKTKPVSDDRKTAAQDLQMLAKDWRTARKQMQIHMGTLIGEGVDPDKPFESEVVKEAEAALAAIDWLPDFLSSPETDTESEAAEPTATKATPQKASAAAQEEEVPSEWRRAKNRSTKIEGDIKLLAAEAALCTQHSIERVMEMRKLPPSDSDKDDGNTWKNVKFLVETALKYGDQQIEKIDAAIALWNDNADHPDAQKHLANLQNQKVEAEKGKAREKTAGRRRIAEAIALAADDDGVEYAIAQKMITAQRPILLKELDNLEGDEQEPGYAFEHEYEYSIRVDRDRRTKAHKFGLHVYYPVAYPALDAKPTKSHYRRGDQLRQGSRSVGYYPDGRRAYRIYRSREAVRGVQLARELLPPDQWIPENLPDRAGRGQ